MSRRPLTGREMQISALVATGMSNKAIAAQLEISEQSVKNMLQRTFDKTGVSNRTELALWILRVAA
jgi:DNA-binding NarL/FixJ family response regulator